MITRIVIVDHRKTAEDFGRILDIRDDEAVFELSEQDQGKTLKVFIQDK